MQGSVFCAVFCAVFCVVFCVSASVLFSPASAFGQESTSSLGNVLNARPGTGNTGFDAVIATSNLDVYLQQQDGTPNHGVVVVSTLNLSGQVYQQMTTRESLIRFNDVAPTEYTIQVVSPIYAKALKRWRCREMLRRESPSYCSP